MLRRNFLASAGLVLTNGLLIAGCDSESPETQRERVRASLSGGWSDVRSQFDLTRDKIHMSAMLVATHPRPVREAIDRYRRELNANPALYLEAENDPKKEAARSAVGGFLGGGADHIALTDSTKIGIALVYHGMQLGPGDEVLTTDHDYYATHEALRQVSNRTGATVRTIELFDEPASVSIDQIVSRITEAVTPRTRVMALTWVHSSTGLKLPVAEITSAVADINRGRDASDRLLVGLDAVHGFGVEDITAEDLGCDFFMAGCHKWLFGPRGTGIVWARPDDWAELRPMIPSFIDDSSWNAWATGAAPPGPTTAARMSPGGFKPFEHQWAIADAIKFQEGIGRARIAERTHALSSRLKDGLAEIDGVRVITPRDEALSAGIVCFDVEGHSPDGVVDALRERDIVASLTPYADPYPRLTPSIYNTESEVDTVLEEIRNLA